MQTVAGLCPNKLELKGGRTNPENSHHCGALGPAKSRLAAAFHLRLSPALRGACRCSHFMAEETEAQRG